MRQSTNRDMTLSVELEKGQTDASPRPLTEHSETMHAALITTINISRVYKNTSNSQPRLDSCAIDYLSEGEKTRCLFPSRFRPFVQEWVLMGSSIYSWLCRQQIPGNISFWRTADQGPRIALHSRTLHDTISAASMRTLNNRGRSRKRVQIFS
jgi:hypothetical protein